MHTRHNTGQYCSVNESPWGCGAYRGFSCIIQDNRCYTMIMASIALSVAERSFRHKSSHSHTTKVSKFGLEPMSCQMSIGCMHPKQSSATVAQTRQPSSIHIAVLIDKAPYNPRNSGLTEIILIDHSQSFDWFTCGWLITQLETFEVLTRESLTQCLYVKCRLRVAEDFLFLGVVTFISIWWKFSRYGFAHMTKVTCGRNEDILVSGWAMHLHMQSYTRTQLD